MAAPCQNEMKESATVVATTIFAAGGRLVSEAGINYMLA